MAWQWVDDGASGAESSVPWDVAGAGTNKLVPWNWNKTPWAAISGAGPQTREEAMAWTNVMLPYLQATMQGQQWGQEFDWRKLVDEWNQQFQQENLDWQKAVDEWSQQFQEKQLAWQQEYEPQRTAMETFGRRWAPNTRWM